MKRASLVLIMLLAINLPTFADDPCEISHWDLQEVNSDGEQINNNKNYKFVIEGIVLNNPGDIVDPTPNYQEEPADMGGQWQIYIQGEGDDHAGTAVYMAQSYHYLPWKDFGYPDPNWIVELERLNSDQFSVGDRVRVTGYAMAYKGKLNINERHNIDDANDFTIELLERGIGQPRPEVVTLNDIKDENDEYIFDHTRNVNDPNGPGCEYWQARLVRINNVSFVDANEWGPQDPSEFQTATITDGSGRTLPVKLGIGSGIYAGSNNLNEIFDIIGIFDQESLDLKAGHRIWVLDYDGNGSVLASREHRQAAKPGDINMNGTVDFVDFAKLADDWLK